jgi:hypothetical protein
MSGDREGSTDHSPSVARGCPRTRDPPPDPALAHPKPNDAAQGQAGGRDVGPARPHRSLPPHHRPIASARPSTPTSDRTSDRERGQQSTPARIAPTPADFAEGGRGHGGKPFSRRKICRQDTHTFPLGRLWVGCFNVGGSVEVGAWVGKTRSKIQVQFSDCARLSQKPLPSDGWHGGGR